MHQLGDALADLFLLVTSESDETHKAIDQTPCQKNNNVLGTKFQTFSNHEKASHTIQKQP